MYKNKGKKRRQLYGIIGLVLVVAMILTTLISAFYV